VRHRHPSLAEPPKHNTANTKRVHMIWLAGIPPVRSSRKSHVINSTRDAVASRPVRRIRFLRGGVKSRGKIYWKGHGMAAGEIQLLVLQ